MTVHSKPLALHMSAQCPSHARTDVRIRDHVLTCDEPAARGGTDQGPAPVEVLVAALTGCTNVIINRLAEMQGLTVRDLRIEASAELDTRGIREGLDLARPIPRVALTLDLASDAQGAALDTLQAELHKRCPVSRVLREAGVEIVEDWRVRPL
ncbi:MAG: OsmC family protein [Pseudomonadota bacterium]